MRGRTEPYRNSSYRLLSSNSVLRTLMSFGRGETGMLRTAYSLASIVLACWITASGASAQQTLRIAMTTADVPTTTGAPNQGLEGFRFAGFPTFEPLVRWDLRVTETVPPVVPWLARSFESDPADREY